MTTLIVGCGMAAVRLVEELLDRGVSDITVIGEEPYAPYNRILLSAVLEGTHRRGALTMAEREWFEHRGVDLRLGTRVVDIHRDRKVVELADRSEVAYDRLVLATGSIPSLPPIRGLVQLDGQLHEKVHSFRTLADCEGLLAALPGAASAVVVGGGLLGLQVARALSIRGLQVEVVEGAEHLLHTQVDEAAGKVLQRSLTKLGTAVYTGTRAVKMTDAGLVLDNGVVLSTDLVILTAGGRPSINLARRAGLDTRRGVIVDDQLRTTDEDIHAIGDCVEHDGRTAGHVSPAWEQAAVLAAEFAGTAATYDGHRVVARLRATDLDVAVLGDPEHAEGEVVQVSNPVTGVHKKLVVSDGVIVAATLVGDLSSVGQITQHFDKCTRLSAGEPGQLLLPPRSAATATVTLPDDAEVCACAGVSAGRIRACTSLDDVRITTRATTGCGGCRSVCEQLVSSSLVKETVA
jgi:assimilatory nitrate reductase electron transfer subunit/nitrite reductase (NADH) large subunit